MTFKVQFGVAGGDAGIDDTQLDMQSVVVYQYNRCLVDVFGLGYRKMNSNFFHV